MEREAGFYWVRPKRRWHIMWEVAQWLQFDECIERNCWIVLGSSDPVSDNELEEINEVRIICPTVTKRLSGLYWVCRKQGIWEIAEWYENDEDPERNCWTYVGDDCPIYNEEPTMLNNIPFVLPF